MGEFLFRVKRFLRFESVEIRHIIISVIVLAFIWGFDDGRETFNFTFWIMNLVRVMVMATVTLLIQVMVQKLAALKAGYRTEYRMWGSGLVLGVILALLTRGSFPLLAPGGPVFYHMAKQRIGDFRYGLNYFNCGLVAAAGVFANLLFAMTFKTGMWIFNIESAFLNELFVFTLVFVLFTSLPIPPMSGVMMFFASKLVYAFLFGVILMYLLLLVIFNVYSLIWGIILGAVLFGFYYWFVEKGVAE